MNPKTGQRLKGDLDTLILNDTSLSITDKIEEVFTILFKNLNNRGKEATDKFAKLVEQKGVVDNEFFRIFERRVGLEQELWENHSLTKHIREILRREIQSLITKEDELRKESEELGKDYVKVQNEMEEIHNRWAKVYNLYKKEVFDPHMEIILKLSRK